jgi:gas vesicle protein
MKFKKLFNRIKGKLKIRKQDIIIFIFALLVYGFYQVLKSDPSTRDAILAFATVIMAFTAFWAIQKADIREKQERKERLLNEIIEWAEDVARLNFKIFNFVEAQISEESWVESSIGGIVSQFQVVEAKGVYINSIAISSFKKDIKLSKAVKAVNKEIRELVDASAKRIDKEITSEEVQNHMNLLRVKILDLFKEVAKIKTEL